MQLSPYVAEVQTQLRAAAALGDDATRRVAEALSAAAEPATRLAVLAAVTAAADEITAALLDAPDAPRVVVRLDGDELQIEVRTAEPVPDAAAGNTADADASARISLRLSEALKSDVEAAAKADAVSVNTWLVRAAGHALGHRNRPGDPGASTRISGHRITGWVNG